MNIKVVLVSYPAYLNHREGADRPAKHIHVRPERLTDAWVIGFLLLRADYIPEALPSNNARDWKDEAGYIEYHPSDIMILNV